MAEINLIAANGKDLNSPAASNAEPDVSTSFWGEDGFTFGDILDLINPLQHLPIIGTIYRAITGDQISTGSSIIGGALFGGFIGAGIAVVNAIVEEATGGEIGDHIMAMFGAGESPPANDAPVVLASAEPDYAANPVYWRRAQEADWSDPAPPAPETAVAAAAETTPQILASAEPRHASNPVYWRWAQEADWSDPAPHAPAMATAAATETTPRSPASAESNYALGRWAQEATMTSLASITRSPAAPAPAAPAPSMTRPGGALAALAARPAIDPVIQALATRKTSLDPAWLAAIPRAEIGVTAAAMRYMTPQTELLLVQAIDLYKHRTTAAKVMTTRPGLVDNLY